MSVCVRFVVYFVACFQVNQWAWSGTWSVMVLYLFAYFFVFTTEWIAKIWHVLLKVCNIFQSFNNKLRRATFHVTGWCDMNFIFWIYLWYVGFFIFLKDVYFNKKCILNILYKLFNSTILEMVDKVWIFVNGILL